MNPKRVAFIIHGLVVGGAEKFFISVVNYFFVKGYQPFVVLLGDDNPLLPELHNSVEYVIIKRKGKYDFGIGGRIKEMLIEREISKVFCVGTFAFFLTRTSFLFDKRFRFFLSLHSTIPKSFKDYLLNFIYFRSFIRRDQVIYICKAQKEYLKKKYFFSPRDSYLVYNGIDTSFFSAGGNNGNSKKEMRMRLNILPDDKVIVKVARLSTEKGHEYGIEALRILHQKYNCKAYLFFVGSGDQAYLKQLTEQVAKDNLQPYIFFVEHQKDVRPYHCLADIFTLTSYTIETFSLAALEAMSSGLPCSLTEIGGAAEMINERSGLLSKAKDAESIADSWFKLLEKKFNPADIHEYVDQNFSLSQMLIQYEKILS
jgi:glycosyltransferase involved in cell wall biosynthesis